jgi:hypothetical protein
MSMTLEEAAALLRKELPNHFGFSIRTETNLYLTERSDDQETMFDRDIVVTRAGKSLCTLVVWTPDFEPAARAAIDHAKNWQLRRDEEAVAIEADIPF